MIKQMKLNPDIFKGVLEETQAKHDALKDSTKVVSPDKRLAHAHTKIEKLTDYHTKTLDAFTKEIATLEAQKKEVEDKIDTLKSNTVAFKGENDNELNKRKCLRDHLLGQPHLQH